MFAQITGYLWSIMLHQWRYTYMMKSPAHIQLLLKLLSSTSHTLQKASKHMCRCGQSSIPLHETDLCVYKAKWRWWLFRPYCVFGIATLSCFFYMTVEFVTSHKFGCMLSCLREFNWFYFISYSNCCFLALQSSIPITVQQTLTLFTWLLMHVQ